MARLVERLWRDERTMNPVPGEADVVRNCLHGHMQSPSTEHLTEPARLRVRREIVDAYRAGMSMDAITDTFHHTYPTIRRALDAAGVAVRPRHRPRGQDVADEVICDAYRAGTTAAEIAARVGLSPTTVYGVLQRHGVSLHGRGVRTAQGEEAAERARVDSEIVVAYRAGLSTGAIARTLHCHYHTIRRALDAAGIIVRPQHRQRANLVTDAAIRDAYATGETVAEIAARLGPSLATVYRVLRRHGVSFRSRRTPMVQRS